MSVLTIQKFNSKILRKKAKKIAKITPEIKKLAKDMIETMISEKGIGLAAPQVGHSVRMIAVVPNPLTMEVFILINPEVIKKSREKEKKEEGCLSFPNIFLEVSRPCKVEVSAMDLTGKEFIISAEGVAAQVLQHEIDHLDGVLFFSRLKMSEKLKFKVKYPKIKSWI